LSFVAKDPDGLYREHGRYGGWTRDIKKARVFSRACDAKNCAGADVLAVPVVTITKDRYERLQRLEAFAAGKIALAALNELVAELKAEDPELFEDG